MKQKAMRPPEDHGLGRDGEQMMKTMNQSGRKKSGEDEGIT